jgi:hypothetical protein
VNHTDARLRQREGGGNSLNQNWETSVCVYLIFSGSAILHSKVARLVSVAKGVFYSKQSHFTAKFKASGPELVALRGAEIVAGVGTRHFHAGRFC